MNTIILYKVVWVNSFGIPDERDFDNETDARNFSTTVSDPQIFRYEIIGSITRLP